LGDLDVDVTIILKRIWKKIGIEDVDWIQLDQTKIHWQTFVNSVMKFRVL